MPKISELNTASALDGTEIMVLIQNGVTVKTSLESLQTFLGSGSNNTGSEVWNGPDRWYVIDNTATWDAENGWYNYDAGEMGMAFHIAPKGAWAEGYRPSSVSLDLYMASTGLEYLRLLAYYNETTAIFGDRVEHVVVGEWKTLYCDLTGMDGDLTSLRIDNSAWLGGLRVRNIVFQE